MAKGIKKAILIFVLAITIAAAVGISSLSVYKYKNTGEFFIDDGYMLLASNDKTSETINKQCYFNAGEKYRTTIDNTISFTDVNGNSVNAEKENFVHYNSGSMNGLAESVILDANNLDTEEQVSYYSIPAKTMLNKSSNNYTVNNAGNNITFSNFLWKISNDRYMVVSEKIELIVGEGSAQTFENYVELRYIDEGIAHLVTQEGTYSTVSSDAYLLLSNGIRIYIGSKNISNEDEIIMNLTQMVVDSDDNIEVVPDEDYTIETDKDPKIVVNANDGETGADGELGDNGDNGNPGVRGSSGAEGDEGKSAENADYIFDPIVAPIFDNIEIDPTLTGFVLNNMDYDSNTCTVLSSYISIVDEESGNEVWRKILGDGGTLKSNYSSSDETPIKCDVLGANKKYTFNVVAKYKSKYDTEAKVGIVNQQTFYTDSFGVSLTKKYITENSLTLTLTKEKESYINDAYIVIKDSQKNIIASGVPCNEYKYENKEVGKQGEQFIYANVFNIADKGDDASLAVGNSMEVEFTGLNSNSYYYVELHVLSTINEEKNNEGEVVSTVIVNTNSFETSDIEQKYLTLKTPPVLNKPEVNMSKSTQSFIFDQETIKDVDNGILSYRYDIYEVTSPTDIITDTRQPDYQYNISNNNKNLNTAIPFSVLPENKKYKAQLVAIFNNNEETVEYRSVLSDLFGGGSDEWPSFIFEESNFSGYDYIGSVNEGRIVISDPDGWLKANDADLSSNTKITLKYTYAGEDSSFNQNRKGYSGYLLDEDGIEINNYDLGKLSRNGDSTEYTMYVAAKSLKVSEKYEVELFIRDYYYVENIEGQSEGVRIPINGQEHSLGIEEFTSKTYPPVFVEAYNVKKGRKYEDNTFAVAVAFTTSNYYNLDNTKSSSNIEEDLRLITSGAGALKLDNYGDISMKSISALELTVYEEDFYNGSSMGPKSQVLKVQEENNDGSTKELGEARIVLYDADYITRSTMASGISSEEYELLCEYNTFVLHLDSLNLSNDEKIIEINKEFTTEEQKQCTQVLPERILSLGNAYYKVYDFNSSLYSTSYYQDGLPRETEIRNNNLIITNDTFEDLFNDVEIFEVAKNTDKNYFIKFTAYDYTCNIISNDYGKDVNAAINNVSSTNTVPIGDKGNVYTGTIRDAYIKVSTSNAVPVTPGGGTDHTIELYYSVAKGLIEDQDKYDYTDIDSYYACPSNIKNGEIDGASVTNQDLLDLWKEKDISSNTSVGVRYSGSDELASYCSSLVNSVRYLVYTYDDEGKPVLVTTSDYMEVDKDNLAESKSGFLPYEYSSDNKTLPEFTFFYDVVDSKTGLSVSRGERYYIETEIVLKSQEYLDDGTTIKVYPRDFGRDDVIYEHCSLLEKPTVYSLPYKATANDDDTTTIDTIYLYVKDPDNAIVNKNVPNNGIVEFSNGDVFGDLISLAKEDNMFVDNANYLYKVEAKKGNNNIPLSIPDSNLIIEYKATINSYATPPIEILSEKNITEATDVTMTPSVLTSNNTETKTKRVIYDIDDDSKISDGKVAFNVDVVSNKTIVVTYQFETDEKVDNGNVLATELILTRYKLKEDYPNPAVVKSYMLETDGDPLTIKNGGETEFKGETVTGKYLYEGNIEIDATEDDILNNIIKKGGTDAAAIKFDLNLYFDSGDYGTYYMSTNSLESNYYAVQNTTNKKYENRNNEEGVLFEKGDLHYIFNSNDVDGKTEKIRMVKTYDDNGKQTNAISFDSKGLTNKVVKKLNIADFIEESFKNYVYTSITTIMPKVDAEAKNYGYNTALLDVKIFNGKNTMRYNQQKDGYYITIEYAKVLDNGSVDWENSQQTEVKMVEESGGTNLFNHNILVKVVLDDNNYNGKLTYAYRIKGVLAGNETADYLELNSDDGGYVESKTFELIKYSHSINDTFTAIEANNESKERSLTYSVKFPSPIIKGDFYDNVENVEITVFTSDQIVGPLSEEECNTELEKITNGISACVLGSDGKYYLEKNGKKSSSDISAFREFAKQNGNDVSSVIQYKTAAAKPSYYATQEECTLNNGNIACALVDKDELKSRLNEAQTTDAIGDFAYKGIHKSTIAAKTFINYSDESDRTSITSKGYSEAISWNAAINHKLEEVFGQTEGTAYWVKTEYNYKNENTKDNPQYLQYFYRPGKETSENDQIKYIDNWYKFIEDSKLNVTNITTGIVDDDYRLSFTIEQSTDLYNLLVNNECSNVDGKDITILAELIYYNTGKVATSTDGTYQRQLINNLVVDDGKIGSLVDDGKGNTVIDNSPIKINFSGLTPSTRYALKLYYVIDHANRGEDNIYSKIFDKVPETYITTSGKEREDFDADDIIEYLISNISKIKFGTEEAETCLFDEEIDVVTKGSGVACYTSGDQTTMSDMNIYFEDNLSIHPTPEGGYIEIIGNNISKVNKIKYYLKETDKESGTKKEIEVEVKSPTLKNYLGPAYTGSIKQYKLSLPITTSDNIKLTSGDSIFGITYTDSTKYEYYFEIWVYQNVDDIKPAANRSTSWPSSNTTN